jgi:hypothetical protein
MAETPETKVEKGMVVVRGKGHVHIVGKVYFEGETIPEEVKIPESLIKRGLIITQAEFKKAEAKRIEAATPKEPLKR